MSLLLNQPAAAQREGHASIHAGRAARDCAMICAKIAAVIFVVFRRALEGCLNLVADNVCRRGLRQFARGVGSIERLRSRVTSVMGSAVRGGTSCVNRKGPLPKPRPRATRPSEAVCRFGGLVS